MAAEARDQALTSELVIAALESVNTLYPYLPEVATEEQKKRFLEADLPAYEKEVNGFLDEAKTAPFSKEFSPDDLSRQVGIMNMWGMPNLSDVHPDLPLKIYLSPKE